MLSLCCIFLSALYFVRSQNITTIPDTNTGDAYITVKEGEINETVVCIVFNPTIQLQSIWRIQRQGEDTMLMSIFFTSNGVPTTAEFVGDLFATGDMIPDLQSTYLTNFTFLNFTTEFDTTRLQCENGFNQERRTFFLGFPG